MHRGTLLWVCHTFSKCYLNVALFILHVQKLKVGSFSCSSQKYSHLYSSTVQYTVPAGVIAIWIQSNFEFILILICIVYKPSLGTIAFHVDYIKLLSFSFFFGNCSVSRRNRYLSAFASLDWVFLVTAINIWQMAMIKNSYGKNSHSVHNGHFEGQGGK